MAVRVWLGEWLHASVRRASPCRHDTDYTIRPITFKLHMHVVYDERWNPIDFWVTLCL